MRVLAASDLPALLTRLEERGYTLVGPVLADGAVTLRPLASADDLAAGWSADTAPGRYRLHRLDVGKIFVHPPAADSLKRYLFPPREVLTTVRREGGGLRFEASGFDRDRDPGPPRYAFVGVRSCDLAALSVLDRVLLGRAHADPRYRARRTAAFLVAVQCTGAAPTCFCASMGTGPQVGGEHGTGGADLVLTELAGDDAGPHRFTLKTGSAAGREMAAELPLGDATDADRQAVERGLAAAREAMGRHLDPVAAATVLRDHPEHPRWDDVAGRCLACANCTMVCPTCFCHTVVEHTGLAQPTAAGAEATRERRWDSCFDVDHSYIHGGSVRTSVRSRYRQWLTHKLSTWVDQFGSSGCAGCGRCITWCPVGIDLTEEVAALTRPATR